MSTNLESPNCGLCSSKNVVTILEENRKFYYKCQVCDVIFVPHKNHLPKTEEKRRYDFHKNNPKDPEYRTFLNRLLKPLIKNLTPSSIGLDYGCGPGPTISEILKENHFEVKNFDPYYNNDLTLLTQKYDFVTATEVAEHFRNPKKDWQKLLGLLKQNGWLGIMTDLTDNVENFSEWYYRRDETHICFYSKKTFKWIAKNFNMVALFPSERVILLKNQNFFEDLTQNVKKT